MKKSIFALALLFITTTLMAQVEQKLSPMSQGNNTAFILPLKKTIKKDVEAAWTKFIKDYKGKTKKDKKSGEIFSDDARIDEISPNTIDVYARVVEKKEDTDLIVWFDLGGAYLTMEAHPEYYPAAVSFLEQFQLSVSTTALEDQVKEQEGLLKKMANELEDLEKEQSKAEADIEKYEQKIEEARQQIQEALAAQKVKESEITGQKKIVEELSNKLKSLK